MSLLAHGYEAGSVQANLMGVHTCLFVCVCVCVCVRVCVCVCVCE